MNAMSVEVLAIFMLLLSSAQTEEPAAAPEENVAVAAAVSSSGLTEVTVKQYSNISLTCQALDHNPSMNIIMWRRKLGDEKQEDIVQQIRNRTPQWFIVDNRMTFDTENKTLHIWEIWVSETGIYTCVGLDANFQESYIEQWKLTVNDVPSAPVGQPVVTATGSAQLTVSWQHSLYDNNSPVVAYFVKYRQPGGSVWSEQKNVLAQENSTVITAKLAPYTAYEVAVSAYNRVGESQMGEVSPIVYTLEAKPSTKPRIENITVTNTSIHVTFRPPKYGINGVLDGYYFQHRLVNEKETIDSVVLNPNITEHTFQNLLPYEHYMIFIHLHNGAGYGDPEERVVQTAEGVPTAAKIRDVRNRTQNSVTVYWGPPERINGILRGYRLYWRQEGEETRMKSIMTSSKVQEEMKSTITDLKPRVEYQFEVEAFTKVGSGARSTTHRSWTDTTGPSAPEIVNATWDSISTVVLHWLPPEHYYNQIDHYLIKYRRRSGAGDPETEQYIGPNMKEGLQKMTLEDLHPGYQYVIQVAGATKSMFYKKYYIGDFSNETYTTCDNDVLCKDEHVKKPIKSNPHPGSIAGVLLGIAVTLLVLMSGIVIFVLRRKYGPFRYWFVPDPEKAYTVAPPVMTIPDSTSGNIILDPGTPNEPDRKAVPKEEWAKHITKLHADGDIGFSQEFDEINQNTRVDLTAQCSAEADNRQKNRYINIVAYDHSRVLLKNPGARARCADYINANYVDGYEKPRAYIAAQGPLPVTFADFWRMVWEQGSEVIVMITNLIERGKRKCDQYWPTEGEHTYGMLTVKLLKTRKTAHYTVRKFLLRNPKIKKILIQRFLHYWCGLYSDFHEEVLLQKTLGEREVLQFHFTDWPDHGVPNYHLPVLDFIHKSASASHPNAGPPVIHCSAGVGRTGTYITVETMIQQIQDQATVNVFEFLSHIRTQRNFLVQTEDQYIFIHDALQEYISSSGWTEVKKEDLPDYIKQLEDGGSEDTPSMLSEQLARITEYKPKDFEIAAAMLSVNQAKNRTKDLVPVVLSRVKLPIRPGVDGSDYFNASFLQGYNHTEEYIVTQHPLVSTIEDFWRMVWDQNSMTVVLLSQVDEKDYVKFWPEKGETKDFGNFKLSLTDETHELSHVSRDFLMESTQDDYECTIRLIGSSYWPESCTPISQAFELVNTVRTWHENNEQEVEGPIIVVDKFGGVEAGTFCALSTLYDQMRHRGAIDVYMIAKLYHLKRPNIFQKQEDILFLYRAIQSVAADIPVNENDFILNNTLSGTSTMPKLSSRSFRESERNETTL